MINECIYQGYLFISFSCNRVCKISGSIKCYKPNLPVTSTPVSIRSASMSPVTSKSVSIRWSRMSPWQHFYQQNYSHQDHCSFLYSPSHIWNKERYKVMRANRGKINCIPSGYLEQWHKLNLYYNINITLPSLNQNCITISI